MRTSMCALVLAVSTVAVAAPPFTFDYKLPPAVRAEPRLKALLDADAAKDRAELIKATREGQAQAKADKQEFNGYESSIDWSVVAHTPRYLSLLAQRSAFTGGAHPNSGSSALIWDTQAKVKRTAASFFVSVAALDHAVGPALCAALNRERQKRGVDVPAGGKDDIWPRCPSLKLGTLLLGSRSKTRFDRIGVVFDQYAVGSYAEGPYEATVPVTAAVLEAVRPADRGAFGMGS